MPFHRTIRVRIAPTLAARAMVLVLTGLGLGFVSPARAQIPGPESFAKPPSTPLEYWDAADYLVRTGQPRLAVPYLNAFLKSNPPDDVLLQIRDRYGVASVFRLQDDPATRPLEQPILDKINAAVKGHATDPARLERSIEALSKSRPEQDYAVDRLKEAGPYAIPALIRAIANPGVSPESRALIVANMGRLDRSTVPPLIAALDSPDRVVAADAARVLGLLRDPRAVPFLTYSSSEAEAPSLREAAREAIERITGKPFTLQPRTPARLLADEAWNYHRHLVRFDSDPTTVWAWDGDVPAPRTVPATVAEEYFGGRFARQALAIAPADLRAQEALVSLNLEKAVERYGLAPVVDRDPSGAVAAATAAGPAVLTDVLKVAIQDGHSPLAAASAFALGRVASRDPVGTPNPVSPLVAALSAPDRRVQYAAASALVGQNPSRPFPGSSRIVPILARFVANRSPRAVIADGNSNRGNSVASTLQAIGYEPEVVASGADAFRASAESADVELILIEPSALQGAWNLRDTLANLRADSRTAGLPVIVFGPLDLRDRLGTMLDDSRTGFTVTPTDPDTSRDILDRQLSAMGARPLSADERLGYGQAAAGLLRVVASRPNGPLAIDLARAEPALSQALTVPTAAASAAAALGDVPGPDAQRSLASVVLDSGRPAPLRLGAGASLARSIQKFGPLLTADQERQLVGSIDSEPDPAVKGALSAVYGALRPEPSASGRRLQSFLPARPPTAEPESGAASPEEATPSPEESP